MKKFLKIAAITFLSFLAFMIIMGKFMTVNNVEKEKAAVGTAGSSTTIKKPEISGVIPGLMPVDVYLSMEKQGFTTKKRFSPEIGYYEWMSKSSVEGLDFIVETSGRKVDNVDRIRATAMIDPGIKKPEAAKPFIQFVSSIPYDGSNPEQAVEWVNKNFNVDKAKTSIGAVCFEIFAPTVGTRILIILPEQQ